MSSQDQTFPERFGPFMLLRQLGVGGMGAAYLAMHAETEDMLVVKRMHPEFIQDDGIFKRFQHEAEVAVHVRHPNVAALIAMGMIDREPFLATEYVFGIQVSQVVDRIEGSQIDRIPMNVGLHLAVDLASGVEAIHLARHQETGQELGLIHRDIGSRNVLVGFDGVIRIIDLGLGKSILADWQTASQVLAGSPDYMPPEQAMGARVDGRADVYAASVTIWELLAGKKRVREEGVAARLTRAIQAQPESILAMRSDASKKLDALIQHAMHPDPEHRIPTAGIFRRALADELTARGKKTSKDDVVAWLDAACATVIAREKRMLEQARAMAKDELISSGARTVFLAVRPGGPFEVKSPYDFYGPVQTASAPVPAPAHAPVQPVPTSPLEKIASSSSVAALAALVDPANFRKQPKRVRVLLAAAAAVFLLGIATITALLARPPTPDVQVSDIPDPLPQPPLSKTKPSKVPVHETVVPSTSPDAGLYEVAEKVNDPNQADDPEPRYISPEVASKKEDLVRKIRQARRLHFDVNFQKKITALSTKLSRARTMRALEEIESALIRLENGG